jgi:peptidoglycan/LPS O-acetylase OafA/YrhL
MRLRNPALDGLRGVAVLAVVVFHAGGTWLPGGWLGVDVFFVLSGFLITTLVVDEWSRERHCDLRKFWGRRARRLLPATVVLLAALAVFAAIDDRALKYRTVRADAFASLASVVNWRFAHEGEAYFDRFAAPSLLRHLWSLSVEAQFYLLWPLLLVLLLLLPGRWTALVATTALALLSAVAMALLASDHARAYFGTDTHAHGLLLGAAAALLCARVEVRGRTVVAGGLLGAVGIVAGFCLLQGNEQLAFRGGIFAVGLATVLVVFAVSAGDARGPLVQLLSSPPLRVLGLLSFGIYLWHWPLLHIFDTEPLVVPLGLTLLVATASYLAVERPVLSGWPRPKPAAWLGVGAVGLTLVLLAVLAVPVAPPQARAEAVAAAHSAYTAAPVPSLPATRRVVVVGDSVALTALPGLIGRQRSAHIEFLSAAHEGCPLDFDATELTGGGDVGQIKLPPECNWQQNWPSVIDRTRPDAVFALWGLWDAMDQHVTGRWLRMGTPAWTAFTDGLLERAVELLSARGAHIIVGTMPYIWSISGRRMDAFNNVVRQVAARHPGVVDVLDMEPEVHLPGVVRWDGVHFTAAGADALAVSLVPALAALIPDRPRVLAPR